MTNNIRKMKDSYFFFLWFGAAVSISEIFSGQLLAPLGLKKGLIVILIGHLIGTTLLILAGVMGTRENASAMSLTKRAFGSYGKILFSLLNILQLLGWTAVMIVTASNDITTVADKMWHVGNHTIWTIIMGLLVGIWVIFAPKTGNLLNIISVLCLFFLTILLIAVLIPHMSGHIQPTRHSSLSIGAGIELTIIMPLSWLPLIADYNRRGKSPGKTAGYTFAGYFLGSAWMYAIGLLLGLLKSSGPSSFLLSIHLGLAALFIVILSTVTTTFLDAYSAGVSFYQLTAKIPVKIVALIMVALGTALALIVPVSEYQNFLYSIGAVFSPIYAIILTDYFLLTTKVRQHQLFDPVAMFSWIIGVIGYFLLNQTSTPIGTTLPVMAATAIIYSILKVRVQKGDK